MGRYDARGGVFVDQSDSGVTSVGFIPREGVKVTLARISADDPDYEEKVRAGIRDAIRRKQDRLRDNARDSAHWVRVQEALREALGPPDIESPPQRSA